jgi:hypothetical protein
MNDSTQTASSPEESEQNARLRERLSDDDTDNEPVSEEALVDADAIGSGLHEDH